MIRREFLKKLLPGVGILLVETQSLFGRALPKIFNLQEKLTIFRGGNTAPEKISLWWRNKTPYMSAKAFAGVFRYGVYFNEEKRKLVIYLPQNKVVVTADNPFVIIDHKAFQMPLKCLWEKNEILVPVQHLSVLIQRYTNLPLVYNSTEHELRVSSELKPVSNNSSYDRTNRSTTGYAKDMVIEQKSNGTVIRIKTSRRFRDNEMRINTRYNWLHVDLYGATANVEELNNTTRRGPVREIKALLLDRTLSIGFRLSKNPISTSIYQDESNRDVVIILRYDENLADSELPEPTNQTQVDNSAGNDLQKQLEQEKKRWLIDTVVIDAGHGGKDPGAVGVGNLKEKDVVLSVALKLGRLINKNMPGVRVVYTRKDDTFVELRRRTQIANENNAKVFISIHANANRNRNAKGFETYILGPHKDKEASNVAARENSVIQFETAGAQKHYQGINAILATMAQSAFMKQSEQLASGVQEEMAKRLRSLNMKNRGVKQAGFWVMIGAAMPSILVEVGFVTNKYEARIIKTNSHQQKIAEGIFSGLRQFKRDYENAI